MEWSDTRAHSGYTRLTRFDLVGFAILFGGSLASWIGSWIPYAIGQIAEDCEARAQYTPKSWNEDKTSIPKDYKMKSIDDM